jgi:hypothetical protein
MRNIMKSQGPVWAGRARAAAVAASSLLTLTGCGAVHTVEPVGKVPVVVDPLEWNGYWASFRNVTKCGETTGEVETGCLIVTVVDSAQGVLAIVPEGKAVEPAHAYIREADRPRAVFITLEDWDSADPVRPLILLRGAIESNGELGVRLVVWQPLKSRFEQLVRDGILPFGGPPAGPPDGPTIGPLDAAEFELLARTMKWELFDWEDPDIYVRVAPLRPVVR